MEVEKTLAKLGLGKKEASIYLTLHRGDVLTATELSKRTGINRRSVYDALDSLSSQGLVSYLVHDKKKLFSTNSLSVLDSQLDEKKQLLKTLIPLMAKSAVSGKVGPQIRVYSGKNSMKAVLEELIATKEIIYIYGGGMQISELLKFYYPHWTKKREAQGILLKGIFIDLPKIRALIKTLAQIQYKFIEKEYLSPAFWWLKGNKIYLVFFDENPIIVSIESASLAKTYLSSFNLLWKNL